MAAAYVPSLKTKYKEQIVPALMKEFGYKSVMQVPTLEKIVINQGLGQAVADKKTVGNRTGGTDRHYGTESGGNPL